MINGLQLGFVYALIALGYTMVYGIVRLINFAHGDVFMVGAFTSYYAIARFGLEHLAVECCSPGLPDWLSTGDRSYHGHPFFNGHVRIPGIHHRADCL